MLSCIRSRLEAWKFKRTLVKSLLSETDWTECKREYGLCGHRYWEYGLSRGEVQVYLDKFFCFTPLSVYLNGIPIWIPLLCRCCIKQAYLTRLYKLAQSALVTSYV